MFFQGRELSEGSRGCLFCAMQRGKSQDRKDEKKQEQLWLCFFNFIKKLTDTSIFIGKEQKTVSKDKGEFGFQKADKG